MRELTIEKVNNGYIVSYEQYNVTSNEYITYRSVFEEEYELLNHLSKLFGWNTQYLLKQFEEMWS